MKRLLMLSLVALAACNNGKDKTENTKVPTSLVNNPLTANGVDTVSAARKPTMDFVDTLHEFGTIHQGELVNYEFAFTNNGKTPLVITNAYGSCGCTVPEYPHDPLAPGAKGIIKVTFNSAGKQGHQEKSVTIRDNTFRAVHMLYIKGEVKTDK